MPKLIYNDPDTGSRVVVELDQEMSEVTVGRNPGNIIRINNPSVSRRHTKFVYEHGEVTLYDLNSSNGTYVNGMRIQEQVLEDGDLVRVGEFPLEFVHEQDMASTQVEDGQVVDEMEQGPGKGGMKSTHMGVGAMGMDDSEGRGGEMAPATGGSSQTRQEFSEGGAGGTGAGGPDQGDDAEFVLDEDDIQEVTEAGEADTGVEPGGGPEIDSLDGGGGQDQTVEASVEKVTGGGVEAGGEFGDSADASDDAQTRRADGDAIAAQLQGTVEEETQADGDSSEIAELQQQVAQFRAELEKAPDREELEAAIAERDEAQGRIDDLEADLADRDDRIESLQNDLAERDSRVESLQSDLAERDETIRELQKTIDELEAENERLENREPAGDGDEQQLRAELEQKEEELQQLRQEVEAFDEEREKKKAIFEELSGDLRELVAEKGTLEERIGELEDELETVRDERDTLLETIDELEDQDQTGAAGGDAEQSDEYQELLEEKESLEETLAEVILERDQLEDELQEVREAS